MLAECLHFGTALQAKDTEPPVSSDAGETAPGADGAPNPATEALEAAKAAWAESHEATGGASSHA